MKLYWWEILLLLTAVLIGLFLALEAPAEHRPQNPVSDQPRYSIPMDVTHDQRLREEIRRTLA